MGSKNFIAYWVVPLSAVVIRSNQVSKLGMWPAAFGPRKVSRRDFPSSGPEILKSLIVKSLRSLRSGKRLTATIRGHRRAGAMRCHTDRHLVPLHLDKR